MTASLGNTAQGTPFATGVDAFVYPQFIGYALRPPSTQDIYNPGTRWQDNSVNPPILYETTGAGRWLASDSSSFTSLTVVGPTSLTGTTNINTTGAAVTNIGSGGTGAVNIGNVTGGTTFSGAVTAVNGLTISAGNLLLSNSGDKIVIAAGANASLGTSAQMTGGTITINTAAVDSTSHIFLTTNTPSGTEGVLSAPQASIVPGVSFVINSSNAADTSTVNWIIFN